MKTNKNLEYYLSLDYKIEIIPDSVEGGYTIIFPELPGCITCCEKNDDIMAQAIDAKKTWLQAALEDGIVIPEPTKINEYSGQFKLRMPKTLHKTLSERAKEEGISMNQYCNYLLSRSVNHPLDK